jgi:putative ATPase
MAGATTENPSFTLNSALLSRCRVVVLDKLVSDLAVAVMLLHSGGFVTASNPKAS